MTCFSAKNIFCFVLFFVGFWGRLGESLFCGLVAKVSQTGTTLGHQPYCSKVGKLKTSDLPRPNITFSSFEGLGRNIFGNFFQHLF